MAKTIKLKHKKKSKGLWMDYGDQKVKCHYKVAQPGPGMLFITDKKKPVEMGELAYIVETSKGLALVHRNDLRELPPAIWRSEEQTMFCIAESNVIAWVEEGPEHE